MALTFPITSDGLAVDVLVNLRVALLLARRAQGQQPQPISGRALVDTGSDSTGVASHLLRSVGAPLVRQTNTHGIGGSVSVDLYRVALHIYDSHAPHLSWIPPLSLLVMELPAGVPFDALIGMDVLRGCKMWVDGPAGQFTLDT